MTESAILDRVPLKLVKELDAAWESYGSTCRVGGTPEQRKFTFGRALRLEHKLRAALVVARDEQQRHEARSAQHP